MKSDQEIIDEIQKNLGLQFSPDPARAMITWIENGGLAAYYQQKRMDKGSANTDSLLHSER